MLGLLGDNYWGEQATAFDSCVRSFLVAAWAAREAAVAARGPTAVLEVALDAEPAPTAECSGACAGWPSGRRCVGCWGPDLC
jgi:hypothetical protein